MRTTACPSIRSGACARLPFALPCVRLDWSLLESLCRACAYLVENQWKCDHI